MKISKKSVLLLASLVLSCGGKEAGHDEHGDHEDSSEEHAEGGHAEGVVKIDPAAVKRMGIEVATVEASAAVGGIAVPAEIQAESDRVAHISSVVSGQLASVTASVGDHVEPKQVLAKVRSIELGQARAQADRARANLQAAKADFARQEDLRKEGIGAQKKLVAARAELARAHAEVSAANRALEVYGRGGSGSEVAIRSPIAGQIVERHASLGEVVEPSQVLFQVTDIKSVWAVGRVYQQNAGQVEVGAAASLTLQAHPGRSWQGTLDYVAPTLDEQTRTLAVRMVLDNPEGVLRPGLFGEISIAKDSGQAKTAPFIRADALQKVGNDLVVFVPEPEIGSFHAVPVSVGQRSQGRVQVISGLKVGDKYVSAGAFVLKSERLRGELGEGHAH